MISAVAALPKEDICCYIIGDGPAEKRLQQLAHSMGVSDQFIFVGKQEHVGDYMQILDAFARLSDQAESFGNSVVEAMGLGIPSLVMSDGGGMVEHFADMYGTLPSDLSELVRSIEYLINNPDAAAVLAKQCQEHVVKKYTIQRMVSAYSALYKLAESNFETKMENAK